MWNIERNKNENETKIPAANPENANARNERANSSSPSCRIILKINFGGSGACSRNASCSNSERESKK